MDPVTMIVVPGFLGGLVLAIVDVPMIGFSIALGFTFGLAGAVAVILRHRRTPPLPSSGRHMGANDVLSLDS